MAVKLITNGCYSGALAGIMATRQLGSGTPADYAQIALVAKAIANQCVTANAALSVPMADADNTEIGFLCLGAARAICEGFFSNDTTATDYLNIARQIVAMAKQCVPQLV